MEPVGVGRRAVATIIDGIVLIIVAFIILKVAGGSAEEPSMLANLLLIVFSFAYYIVMEKTSGATLGKMAMGLKVVRKDGQPMDWVAAVIRTVLRIIDGIGLYLVAAIAVWVSKDKQRLGDMAAGTQVVRAGG